MISLTCVAAAGCRADAPCGNMRRSAPVKAVVPHSKPELVYDIKYFNRERRRAEEKALFGADAVKVRAPH